MEKLENKSAKTAARNSSQTGESSGGINESSKKITDQIQIVEIHSETSQEKIKLTEEIKDINALLKKDASSDENISSYSEKISDLVEFMAGPNTKFEDTNARSLKKLKSLKDKLETAKSELEKNNSEESDQNSISDKDKDLMAKIAELKSKKIGYKKELKSVKSLEKQAEYLSDTIKSKEGRRSKRSDQISKPVLKANTQDPVKKIDDFNILATKWIDDSNKYISTSQKLSDFGNYEQDLKNTSKTLKTDLENVKAELKAAKEKLGIKPSFTSRLLSGKLNPFKSSQKAAQTTGSTTSVDTSSTTSSEGASQLNED